MQPVKNERKRVKERINFIDKNHMNCPTNKKKLFKFQRCVHSINETAFPLVALAVVFVIAVFNLHFQGFLLYYGSTLKANETEQHASFFIHHHLQKNMHDNNIFCSLMFIPKKLER